jgi:hypothetical protein
VKPEVFPTGWKRVYAILSMRDGGCYETDAALERCLLLKGHKQSCQFTVAPPIEEK